MKSWLLLALLALRHYGSELVEARWHAFTSVGGLIACLLLWQIKGKRWSMIWWVCMFGISEEAQVFVCQATAAAEQVQAPRFSGLCEAQTGLPLYTLGLMVLAALAALWLDRNRS